MALSASAISKAWASDSIWQGPAMSTNGRWLAMARSPTCTVRGTVRASTPPCRSPTGLRWSTLHEPCLLDRRLDEAGEERVRGERLGFQLGVILHADEPGVSREF